jgi:lysophospholipid acyltransferase (LPLAT)-like uncharacterized protein
MRLRAPWLIKLASLLGTWLVRLLVVTLRYKYHAFGPVKDPYNIPPGNRYLCIFWHENLMLPAYYFARPDILVLISQHADGQLIAEICQRLGFGLIRGSTTRGSVEAVRQMLRVAGESHVAITPDGPRGPRRRVQLGVVYLAAKTGMPIIPMGIGYDRPWRMKSWDRFAIPRPFRRARCITGRQIVVPENADRDQIEAYRQQVEEALLSISDAAEQWAKTDSSFPPDNSISEANTSTKTAEKARRVG